jgi:hypothetical protein
MSVYNIVNMTYKTLLDLKMTKIYPITLPIVLAFLGTLCDKPWKYWLWFSTAILFGTFWKEISSLENYLLKNIYSSAICDVKNKNTAGTAQMCKNRRQLSKIWPYTNLPQSYKNVTRRVHAAAWKCPVKLILQSRAIKWQLWKPRRHTWTHKLKLIWKSRACHYVKIIIMWETRRSN